LSIKQLIVFFSCLLFCWHTSFAQDYEIKNITAANGLPTNQVYSVYKDSKNFMWFCTESGAVRYNGMDMTTYTMKDGLADNDVFQCKEDKWGRIWFATYNGQLSFFKNGKFYNANNCDFIPKIPSKNKLITTFIQNGEDSSLIVIHLKSRSNFYQCFGDTIIKRSLNFSDTIENLLYFKDGESYSSLNYPSKSIFHTIRRYKNKTNTVFTSNKYYAGIYGLLLETDAYPYQLFRTKNRIFEIKNGLRPLLDINPKDFMNLTNFDGYRVLAYRDGLRFEKNGKSTDYLKGKFITGMGKDNYGNLYVTTYSNGVFVISKKTKPQKTLPFSVRSLTQDKSKTFLISKNKTLYSFTGEFKKIKTFTDINEINYENGLVLYKRFGNLYNYEVESGKKVLITKDSVPTKQTFFYNKRIFFRTRNEIFFRNANTLKKDTFESSRTLHGILRKKNQIWAFGQEGFFHFKNEQFTKVPFKNNYAPLSACLIGDDLFFINYADYKLYKVTDFTTSSNTLTAELFSRKKYSGIKKIAPNTFLIHDQMGVNEMVSITKKSYSFSEINYPIKTVSLQKIYSDSNRLFISRLNSTDIFPIQSIVSPSWEPSVTFEKIVNQNNRLLSEKKDAYIPFPDRKRIYINYLILGKHNSLLTYEYAINTKKNSDTTWIPISKPEIDLINPSWGRYEILFRARNSARVYSDIEKIRLKIQAPFYLRWWFIILAGLILLGMAIALDKRRQEIKFRKKENEIKFLKAEFKSLNALMNPHFIFNSLNSIQRLIRKDSSAADEYLVVFSNMVRQNMKNIKNEIIPLEKEIGLIENYLALENLRLNGMLKFEIKTDEFVLLNEIEVPPLSIQPIVENSVKHGIAPLMNKVGKIEINISEQEDEVHIIVKDNGVGFNNSQNKEGSNSALKNIRKRLQVLSEMHEKQYSIEVLNTNPDSEFRTFVLIKIPNE
jgi:hypothetical protein